MAIYYSAGNRGFYDSDIHMALPPDAIEIERSHHAALLEAQNDGKEIVPGVAGLPEAVDRLPSTDELAASVLHERDTRLSEADKLTQADRWESYTPERREEIATYKQELRDVPLQPGFPASVAWPELP